MRSLLLSSMVILALSVASKPAGAAIEVTHLDTDMEMLTLLSDTPFVGEGRIGDRAGTAAFELSVGAGTSGPESSAQYDWQSGVPVDFTLTYDYVTDDVVLTVGDVTLHWTSPRSGYSDIFLRTRAVNAGSEISLNNLVLNSEPVGDVSQADGDTGGLDILWIHGATLGDGFALTGSVTMTWTGAPPTESRLSFQVKVGKIEPVPVEELTWAKLKSLYR
jgi:hypothetical protein